MQRTHVDRGGTFTDVVTLDEQGHVRIRKVPSDRAIVGELAMGELTLGTTVATNALLERTGVPTVLLVNRGLEDLVCIGDMSRPSLFDPERVWPEPLCFASFGIPGRLDFEGHEVAPLQVEALENPDVDRALRRAQAVAIVGLHLSLIHI